MKMSKDGTVRGGARTGAGRKGRSTAQKILDGAQELSLHPELLEDEPENKAPELPEWAVSKQKAKIKAGDLDVDVPELQTERIYKFVWSFLNKLGVVEIVSPLLLIHYSFEAARYVQVEQITSLIGFTFPHPTTGAPMASPYIAASMSYLKQANILWCQITQVIRDRWEGSSYDYGRRPNTDDMEYLLTHNPRAK